MSRVVLSSEQQLPEILDRFDYFLQDSLQKKKLDSPEKKEVRTELQRIGVKFARKVKRNTTLPDREWSDVEAEVPKRKRREPEDQELAQRIENLKKKINVKVEGIKNLRKSAPSLIKEGLEMSSSHRKFEADRDLKGLHQAKIPRSPLSVIATNDNKNLQNAVQDLVQYSGKMGKTVQEGKDTLTVCREFMGKAASSTELVLSGKRGAETISDQQQSRIIRARVTENLFNRNAL